MKTSQMADNRQLINVRTWQLFNELLAAALPIESVKGLLLQLSSAWLDIARAETVVVSILRSDKSKLLVARADRAGSSFRAVNAASDSWDEEAAIEIADNLAGYSTASRYEPTILLTSQNQFEGGVILGARETRPLDTSATQDLTSLTECLIDQAITIENALVPASRPKAIAITGPLADDESVPLAEPLEHIPSQPAEAVPGISEQEFEKRLQRAKLEAMAEFAAGAGHEINNPIASIAGRVELLLRSETNPDRRQSLAAIGGQAYRVRDMIGDAMLFGRPPSPHPTNCSLNEAVKEVIDKLQATDRGQTCRFPVEMAPDVVVFADPTQLRVVISALINNAIEAIREHGEIRVRTKMVTDETDLRFGQLEITDNGIGMAARDREFLFDPFYSGRQAGRGLGFGLPKCWKIIEQHHGHIEFDSCPGGPTTFTILWPASESSQDRRHQQHTAPVSETIADQLIEERREDTGYRIPRRRKKRSF
jgi:signal transduction histidine kinase